MNTISNTAYYCCGVRMEDAERTRSVCSDIYARRFMDEDGYKLFEPFKSETMPNISNIARCRIIDDWVRDEIQEDANTNIVTVGAGFDTRPYRLTGGVWTEIDEPQIIDYKNKKLPVEECSNQLRRLSIDFAKESLTDKLSPGPGDPPTVVVVEGVFMYLTPEDIDRSIKQIQSLYREHILLCDLMTKNFFHKFARSVHSKLAAAGGSFSERPDRPERMFMENGYAEVGKMPMFQRALELGLLWDRAKIPAIVGHLMLRVFMKDLQGYAVHRFGYPA